MAVAAPPTGGSPYQVGGKEVRIVGNIRADEVEQIGRSQVAANDQEGSDDKGRRKTASVSRNAQQQAAPKTTGAAKGPQSKPGRSTAGGHDEVGQLWRPRAAWPGELVDRYAANLRSSQGRIRVEGYAQPGDANPREASLARANIVRDQLVANGIGGERIDAVGTGLLASDGVRIVAGEEQPMPAQGNAPPAAGAGPQPEPSVRPSSCQARRSRSRTGARR